MHSSDITLLILLKYYQTVRFENALNNRLGSVVNNSLRAVLGRVPLSAVISDRREELMAEVTELVSGEQLNLELKYKK